MRRWTLSLGLGSALVACLAFGAGGSAGAATLDFTGTLSLRLGSYPVFVVSGAGTAQLTDDGSLHLLSLALPGGAFGPITSTIDLPLHTPGSGCQACSTKSLRFTSIENLTGSFPGISGGPPAGGPMGLQGIAKVCLLFSSPGTCNSGIFVPLAPTTGGAGFGLGGTRTATYASGPEVTLRNAPWTIGQPTMTIHTPGSTITIPVLPGGFAHGPASVTSSTAQPSGAIQLVTATKVFTSLTNVVPEFPVTGLLNLHFVPEPGTLLLLGSGVAALTVYGRRRRRR